jgi:ABC-2 type transport system ATP-binding protein
VFVETRSLTKHYGTLAALADCDLQIARGEVFGLLGPNGSGKSTLLRLVLGFLRPTRGVATVDGLDCYRQSLAVHAKVSYLPGDARLFRHMRGREVLAFFAGLRGGAVLTRARQLAERLELDLSRVVGAMSTGMRQKLALAVTLAAETPLVILDEPTANLDPTVRTDVIALIREAQAAGQTVIFSSHVLEEVENSCDRVGILRQGQLVHTQIVSQLRRQHRIWARLTGPMPPIPVELASELTVQSHRGELSILAPGELLPVLRWLATLPLAEVRIEPVRLNAVYERYHAAAAS